MGRIAAPLARQLTQRRIPVVNVWANSRATGIPRVGFDHTIAGRLRAEHLLDRGLQQFATLGVADNATYVIKARQFAAEVEAAAELLDRLIDGAPPPEAPILLPPIGIVARASTDFTAIGDELVQSALRYISGHLNERLRVGDVAAAALTSRATLERRFREHLGRPVATEIRRLRIEKAKRALARSTTPIYRIAQECGFASAAELSRTFGQEVGQTPSAFRRSRQMP